jgi:hypothetical protein
MNLIAVEKLYAWIRTIIECLRFAHTSKPPYAQGDL